MTAPPSPSACPSSRSSWRRRSACSAPISGPLASPEPPCLRDPDPLYARRGPAAPGPRAGTALPRFAAGDLTHGHHRRPRTAPARIRAEVQAALRAGPDAGALLPAGQCGRADASPGRGVDGFRGAPLPARAAAGAAPDPAAAALHRDQPYLLSTEHRRITPRCSPRGFGPPRRPIRCCCPCAAKASRRICSASPLCCIPPAS